MISASVVICDDVRQEANGKALLIGVYGPQMSFATFPVTLDRICLVVKIASAIDDPFSNVAIRVERPDMEPFLTPTIPVQPPPNLDVELAAKPGAGRCEYTSLLPISPFELVAPGPVRVVVIVDGESIDAGGLYVSRATAPLLSPIQAPYLISFYNQTKARYGDKAPQFAAQILDLLARDLPELTNPDLNFIVGLSEHEARIVFPRPRDNVSVVIADPSGEELEILDWDMFGVTVRLPPDITVTAVQNILVE